MARKKRTTDVSQALKLLQQGDSNEEAVKAIGQCVRYNADGDYARIINWVISQNISGALDDVAKVGTKSLGMSPDALVGYLSGLRKIQSELNYYVEQELNFIENEKEELRGKRRKTPKDEFIPSGLEISPDGNMNAMVM
jgi:hypothetical protein